MDDPKSQRDPKQRSLDPELQVLVGELSEILQRPNHRKHQPGMDWEVWSLHDDGLEPWRVTSLRMVPRVSPMMPDDLVASVNRYRAQLFRGQAVGDDPVFERLRIWLSEFDAA